LNGHFSKEGEVMKNLLDAIVTIHNQKTLSIVDAHKGKNRANNMGEALESFVKDAFADSFNETNTEKVNAEYNKTFSYFGNQNNPPDAILKGGDAIEIKKVEGNASSLALNSSYPKDKLYADSPMITMDCRNCEIDWKEKDIIYAVGVVKDNNINRLCFVYGEDYAANHETYERIRTTIKNGIDSISDVEFGETKELGRVNKVDPLGITYLRIRGMWGIEIPFSVFDYVTNGTPFFAIDRKSTRLNSSHPSRSRMPSSA
jgi:hypothetical protein